MCCVVNGSYEIPKSWLHTGFPYVTKNQLHQQQKHLHFFLTQANTLLLWFLSRELSKRAQKTNNVWWKLSGLLGDQNRLFMYILFQGIFTVLTMALAVPIFLSYRLHVVFQLLKVSAAVWNGGSFLLEVMPRQVIQKEKKKTEIRPLQDDQNHHPSVPADENGGDINSSEPLQS